VQTVWDIWETGGHAAMSARALAQGAGVPLSTLYNHFPSLDHVFLQAQEDALAQATLWCAAHLEHLSFTPENPPPLTPDLGPIMAALIDEWTHGQRRLAFAWRESFLLAKRDPRYQPVWQGWRDLWSGFWQAICATCGLGEYGEWTSFVFEAEAALHMLSWRRALDRACLEELCQGWAGWLGGHLVSEGPWRQFARQQALASFPDLPIRDDTAQRVADAAADVVEHLGMARLTHRAVAASAGVSLGMVSSRFRTSLDLVRAAFDVIYRRLATPSGDDAPVGDVEQAVPALTGEQMSLSHRLAIEELMLAVAREAEFRPFAPQLRYLRGRTSGQVLQMMAGPGITVSRLDAAVFSDLVSGMQRAGIGLSPQEKASSGRAHLARMLAMLGLPALELDQTRSA
jgi:AcrR family transcriptional regulator